jgi:hypothetical protein
MIQLFVVMGHLLVPDERVLSPVASIQSQFKMCGTVATFLIFYTFMVKILGT